MVCIPNWLINTQTNSYRFPESQWQQCRNQGSTYNYSNLERRAQFILLFPTVDHLHGIWHCETDLGKNNALCSNSSLGTFCVRCGIWNCKLSHNSRQCWTVDSFGYCTTSWISNSILCLDTQLSQRHFKGSNGQKAKRQSTHVPQIVVVHPGQHPRNLRLLLPQLILLCSKKQRRLCPQQLENKMVRARRLAESSLPLRHWLYSLPLATNSQQPPFCHERRSKPLILFLSTQSNNPQIAQDDDGNFEIASFGGSLDEEEGTADAHPSSQINASQDTHRPGMPKEAPQRARHSLDGETIFAIGEDGDKLSDDDDDDDSTDENGKKREGRRLVQ